MSRFYLFIFYLNNYRIFFGCFGVNEKTGIITKAIEEVMKV